MWEQDLRKVCKILKVLPSLLLFLSSSNFPRKQIDFILILH